MKTVSSENFGIRKEKDINNNCKKERLEEGIRRSKNKEVRKTGDMEEVILEKRQRKTLRGQIIMWMSKVGTKPLYY